MKLIGRGWTGPHDFGLSRGAASAVLAGVLLGLSSLGHAATATSAWTVGQAPTTVTNIAGPSNAQQTTFTGYTGGSYNYVLYPFTVSTNGNYTATSTTGPSVNTTWFVRGTFSPGAPPTTPLSEYIVAVLSANAGAGVNTGTFTSVPLVAGQQYTMLVAFNVGSVAGEVSTVTINGPGCIALGSTVCTPVAIPTLSEWGVLLMTAMVAGVGLFMARRNGAAST